MTNEGTRKFRIFDTSTTPNVIRGDVSVRDAHNETAEEAAHRRARSIVGHDNYRLEEYHPTIVDKATEMLDRMAELFRNS